MDQKVESKEFIMDGRGISFLCLGFIFITFAISLLHQLVLKFLGFNLLTNTISFMVLNTLTLLVPIFFFKKFVLEPKNQHFNFSYKSCTFKEYVLIIPMMLGMILMAEYFGNLIPTEGKIWGEWFDSFTGQIGFIAENHVIMFIMVVIIAPILEEVLFRGIVLKGLLNKGMPDNTAIFVSSLAFAIFHANPWQFVGALCLGMVLGLAYERTKTLLAPILLHALNNLISTILMLYTNYENTYEVFGVSPQISLAIGVVVFSFSYYAFNQLYKEQTA